MISDRSAAAPRSSASSLALLIISAGVETYLAIALVAELAFGYSPFHNTHYDFLAFYSAGSLVLHERAVQVYDPSAISFLQHLIIPRPLGAAGYMPFLNPPFVSALLAPLALMPVWTARILWTVFNAGLAAASVNWLVRQSGISRRTQAVILLLGSFPIYQGLVEGQLSIVMFAVCCLALARARVGREGESGLLLSVLWFKPQLALPAVLALALFRRRRMALAMVLGGLGLVVVTLPFTNWRVYGLYAHFLSGVTAGHFNGAGALVPSAWQGALSLTAGINGLFVAIWGQSNTLFVNSSTAILSAVLLGLYALALRKVRPGFGEPAREMMMVASLALILLIDPHLYPQDVSLAYLGLPFVLLHFRRPWPVLLCAVAAFNSMLIDQVWPLHLFTLALAGFTVYICLQALKGNLGRQEPVAVPEWAV